MINCNGTKCKNINYNGNDVKILNLNGNIVWAKPYSLTILSGGGIKSLTVRRTSTKEPSSFTGTLSSGATIYHGDTLTVDAQAEPYYAINEYTTQYTVSDNVLIKIVSRKIADPEKISSSGNFTYLKNKYTETITIKNDSGAEITLTNISGSILNDGEKNIVIANGESEFITNTSTWTQAYDKSYTVSLTIVCAGITSIIRFTINT